MFNVENSGVKYVGFCFFFLMYEAISSSSFSELIPILGLMVPVIHIHHASSRGEEQNWRKDLGSPWLDPMNPDSVILPGNFYPAPLETFSLVNSPFLCLWPFSIPLTISSTLSSCKITCFYLYVCVYTCICICIYIYAHTYKDWYFSHQTNLDLQHFSETRPIFSLRNFILSIILSLGILSLTSPPNPIHEHPKYILSLTQEGKNVSHLS